MPLADQAFATAAETPELLQRPGAFRISRALLETDPEAFLTAIAGVAIVRCEFLHVYDCIEYVGYCADFERQDFGNVAPRYECLLTLHIDPETGARSVTRAWKREGDPLHKYAPADGFAVVPVAAVKFLLESCALWDAGPPGQGWQSPEMEKAVQALEAAVGKPVG
jgi:hypothetical protein